jgi:hypothetical protein
MIFEKRLAAVEAVKREPGSMLHCQTLGDPCRQTMRLNQNCVFMAHNFVPNAIVRSS